MEIDLIHLKNDLGYYNMFKRPAPAAIGIVFNSDKSQVLLVKREDVSIWVLPGGGIDLKETPAQAAIREVKEETGLDVSIEYQSGEYYPINRLASQTAVFVCIALTNKILPSDETAGCQFFDITEARSILFPLHCDWLNNALKYTHLITQPIDQITYWGVLKYALQNPLQLIRFILTRIKNPF
jgi:8-oxo-dGTP diphosphatase